MGKKNNVINTFSWLNVATKNNLKKKKKLKNTKRNGVSLKQSVTANGLLWQNTHEVNSAIK